MLVVHCGEGVAYEEALRWQRLLVEARRSGAIDDVALTLSHDRVYTAGRHADVARHVLGTRDIRVVPIDRGGDVTYHGPGQLVVYPIVELAHAKAVRPYVEALEEAAVRTAAGFGITARADRQRTGVWVGEEKLVAIGIRVDGRVTSHGLAFNVEPDLEDFGGIVPCGIADAGVCSLASLGVAASLTEVRRALLGHLGELLARPLQQASPADLGLTLSGAASAEG
ncbi:MAG: lipoyl(octanoyl) transferase LipB [Actinomycetota bacterium]